MPDEQTTQTETQTTETPSEKTFSQAEVNRIVKERLDRDRQKFADYDELRTRVSEFEKQQEQLSQMELEKKQEYEKLKEQWGSKENEYKEILSKKDMELRNERINNKLSSVVLKNNAYPETIDLLKSMAQYNDDGTITIKGKDSNGMDLDLPIEDGVQQFLKDRPYLVKGSGNSGAGTSTQASGTGADVNLAQELQNAMAVGDRKRIVEIKQKIKSKHSSQGLSSVF